MKKLICTGLIIAMIICLSSCTVKRSAEELSADVTATQTVTDPVPDEELFAETLNGYYDDRTETAAELGYDIENADYFYCIRDINSDGKKELIITENPENGNVYALYTDTGSGIRRIMIAERHGQYRITADGRIQYTYKGEALYELRDAQLFELYYVVPSASSENENEAEEAMNAYKQKNGISADMMKLDFREYHYVPPETETQSGIS